MSVQEWDIHGPADVSYTPEELAQIARAAQAFQAAVAEVGAPTAVHLVRLLGIGVMPTALPSSTCDDERPGILAAMVRRAERRAAATQLAPCEICGFEDWPEGGMHAARNIHMQAHEFVVAPTSAPAWPAS